MAAGDDLDPDYELTLDDVDRRRTELWTTSLFVVAAVTVAIAIYLVGQDLLPESLQVANYASWVALVLVGGLVFAFLIYIIEKERSLRRMSALLVEERVRSTDLTARLEQISRLSAIGRAVNTMLRPQETFDRIISSALELLGGDQGSIMELDESHDSLVVVFYTGPQEKEVLGETRKLGEAISGRVAKARKGELIQGPGGGEPGASSRSSMCVPLIRQEQLLGVLNVSDTSGSTTFTDRDLEALGFFAEHAAIAIGNARAFEKERQTIARLEEVDRMKSDFVATMSHELKTPLTSIIGAAKTVGRRAGQMDAETQASFIEIIDRQGQRLLRLVEDVLTTSRIESGPRPMRRERLDLRDVASQIIGELALSDVGRGRTIELQTEPDRPVVWADITALQQILLNLCENACKYSPTDKPVAVLITEGQDEVTIEVRDQGYGIAPAQLGTIFERFHQVDSSSTRGVGGVGLGLFIVKNLAEANGGTVSVDSEAGVGSTFRVTFRKRSGDRRETG